MMQDSNIAGIVWKLDYDDLEGKSFKVHWGWCGSAPDGRYARIKVPESWNFTLPPDTGFRSDLFGASETRGLLGGVRSRRLESLSEQCERAIGDILTHAVCQLVDHSNVTRPIMIVIFGPALPKVVGRICSLRLVETVTISWICPSPFPAWIAQRADELLLVPRRHASVRDVDLKAIASQSWDEEPLLAGFRWNKDDRSYVVQYVCNRPFRDPVDELGLNRLRGLAAEFASQPFDTPRLGVWLPREILASAGQVEAHISEPYSEQREMLFRYPPEAFATKQLYDAGTREQQNRSVDGVFVIPWGEQVAG